MRFRLILDMKKLFKRFAWKNELSNVKDQFGDVLVPVEEVVELKAGQKQLVKEDYILAMSCANGYEWCYMAFGKKHTKSYSFIGGSALKPTPIKDNEVELILRRMDDSKVNPTQKLTFEVANQFV